MAGFPSPFSGDAGDEKAFDEYDEFVRENLPAPGAFLQGHDVLEGDAHVAVHGLARELFEERGVYDVTFGYNLARLNLDRQHPDAGFRYARELGADDRSVLRAEFTPTTEFCPQSDTLARGAFRAWNGLPERHEYDLVRLRVDETHHQSDLVNEATRELEQSYLEDGSLDDASSSSGEAATGGAGRSSTSPF